MPPPFRRIPFAEVPERPRLPHAYDATRARTLSMRSRPFGQIDVHYREHGEGPPLLLVHGLMTTSYSWRYVVEPLGRRYRVIAPDLPGAGRSGKPAGARYTADALAEWIGELQQALGIEGCLCVGNSLGGYLSMLRAQRDPKAFARLVNIHSPAAPAFRYRALSGALATPGARALLDRTIARDPLRWAWKNVHYYDETLKSLEEAHAYGDPLATKEGRAAFLSYLSDALDARELAAFCARLERDPFPVPLLLLYAREDPLVPPSNGELLARLVPRAKLVWIDRSSHFAHVDTPDPVVREVLSFLGTPD